MLGWVVGGIGTFVVSLAFACVFLKMRCRGLGPPFGPHARPWGIFIAVATALDARFDFELSSLKTPDAYTSRSGAESAPAANHHSFPRAQHQKSTSRHR